MSARTAHTSIDALPVNLMIAGKSEEYGIKGYKLPRHGLPPKHPVHAIPKDKL